MILFNFPPFLVDRLNFGTTQGCITRDQIENALTVIFVCKDLLAKQKGEFNPDQISSVALTSRGNEETDT